jgi:RHS repeat-associated protein
MSATFTYDALGRRITKIMNGTAASFQYDGADLVRESGPTGDASYLRKLNIDETLTRTDASGTLVYLADALGSTVALLDTSGALTTEYIYEPFGATQTRGLAIANPFQFTGRENDGRGLYYYRARYMDPARGRFIQEDPLGLTGGSTHLYQYVLNSPLNLVDPTGLVPKWMVPKQVIQNTQDTISDLSPGAFNQKELDHLTDKVISEIGLLEAKELADLAPIPGQPLELTKQQAKTLQDVLDRLRRKNPNDALIKKLEDEWKKALKKGRVTIK